MIASNEIFLVALRNSFFFGSQSYSTPEGCLIGTLKASDSFHECFRRRRPPHQLRQPQAIQVLFTDSWGAGHELKRMSLAGAYTSTDGLYTLTPRSY